MKVLSRFASPGGFALVLLLFFLLPFVSVSCDVPGYGEAGVNYTGTHLVTGATPAIPDDLQRVANDPETPAELVDPPDPGVQVLAIALAALAAAGVLTAFVGRVRTRLLTGTALAVATLAVTMVTMAVTQSNLQSALIDSVRHSGLADQQETLNRVEAAADDLTHTEVGFWLMTVLLTLTALVTGVLALLGHRLRPSTANDTNDTGGLSALSLNADDPDEHGDQPSE